MMIFIAWHMKMLWSFLIKWNFISFMRWWEILLAGSLLLLIFMMMRVFQIQVRMRYDYFRRHIMFRLYIKRLYFDFHNIYEMGLEAMKLSSAINFWWYDKAVDAAPCTVISNFTFMACVTAGIGFTSGHFTSLHRHFHRRCFRQRSSIDKFTNGSFRLLECLPQYYIQSSPHTAESLLSTALL